MRGLTVGLADGLARLILVTDKPALATRLRMLASTQVCSGFSIYEREILLGPAGLLIRGSFPDLQLVYLPWLDHLMAILDLFS